MDRLAAVWTQVPTGDSRDVAAFREVYTDPGTLNGRDTAIGELVERYRMLHESFADLDIDVVDRTEMPGTLAVPIRDERISQIWVVADELSRLAQLEAITLAAPADDT